MERRASKDRGWISRRGERVAEYARSCHPRDVATQAANRTRTATTALAPRAWTTARRPAGAGHLCGVVRMSHLTAQRPVSISVRALVRAEDRRSAGSDCAADAAREGALWQFYETLLEAEVSVREAQEPPGEVHHTPALRRTRRLRLSTPPSTRRRDVRWSCTRPSSRGSRSTPASL